MSNTNNGGHWYDPKTGQPMHWVPKKDGTGNRNTTLADARKLGLYPSVTGVLNALAKPALQAWIIKNTVHAVVTAPDVPGETLDAKVERILAEPIQESEQAKDRGTEIHAALEQLAQGKSIEELNAACAVAGQEPIGPWIMPAWRGLADVGAVHASEIVLVGYGYAGRCDLVLRSPSHDIIVDFKSCKVLPKKGAYNDHKLQCSAYAAAHQELNPQTLVETANLYISTVEPGAFMWCENPPWREDFEVFKAVLAIWQWQNNYKP